MRAFTLIELIIVLVILGLVAAIGLPSINKARLEAEIESKRAFAVQLENARMSLIEALGHDTASSKWSSYATQENIYDNLLKTYMPANAPADLDDMFTSGYTVSFNGIDGSITLTGPSSTTGTTTNIPLYKY
jgi:prepilin-type N-terminal cleavage/methylation domain-containing protein